MGIKASAKERPHLESFAVDFKANLNLEGKGTWRQCSGLFMLSKKGLPVAKKTGSEGLQASLGCQHFLCNLLWWLWCKFMKLCGGDFPGNSPRREERGGDKSRCVLDSVKPKTDGECGMFAWAPRTDPGASDYGGPQGGGASATGNQITGETLSTSCLLTFFFIL